LIAGYRAAQQWVFFPTHPYDDCGDDNLTLMLMMIMMKMVIILLMILFCLAAEKINFESAQEDGKY